MKKIFIILVLLITSCASRKVDVSKSSIETKVDSSVIVKIDGTYVKEANVAIVENYEELEYKPLDNLKPMVIDGKSYINTIVKSKKKKTVKIDKTKEIAKVSSVKKINVKKDDVKKGYVKKVDKKTNYYVLLWLLLPILIIWFLEKYSGKIFPFIKYFK